MADLNCQGVEPNYIHVVDGQPQSGIVGMQQWSYYQFVLDNQTHAAQDLTISLTRQYGDPDLYVSCGGMSTFCLTMS